MKYYLSYIKDGRRGDWGKTYSSPEAALEDAKQVNRHRHEQGLPLITMVVNQHGEKVAEVPAAAHQQPTT